MQTIHSDQPWRVFKFGGASVKDGAGLQNVASILQAEAQPGERLLVVVSAMGKTTNALEAVLEAAFAGLEYRTLVTDLIDLHRRAVGDAMRLPARSLGLLNEFEGELIRLAERAPEYPFDEAYDQLVSIGEVMSSYLLQGVLQEAGLDAALWDARDLVGTDSNFRAPLVDVAWTNRQIQAKAEQTKATIQVVQGFIGRDSSGRTTTLGREGSDYTAALFGNALKAESVTVWKDVPGVLNADPKRLSGARLLPILSYAAAAEMTFYGATVLHPKTLKPLADAGIPLYVRSFLDPAGKGTYIGEDGASSKVANIFIWQNKVALIRCRALDLSFVSELHLAEITQAAYQVGLRVLMLQSSALELQLVVVEDFQRAAMFAERLGLQFRVEPRYNLALATFIRAEKDFIQATLPPNGILLHQAMDERELFLMVV